jgi:hypothetical protein
MNRRTNSVCSVASSILPDACIDYSGTSNDRGCSRELHDVLVYCLSKPLLKRGVNPLLIHILRSRFDIASCHVKAIRGHRPQDVCMISDTSEYSLIRNFGLYQFERSDTSVHG